MKTPQSKIHSSCATNASIPTNLDATRWEQLEPHYKALLDRTLRCENCLEKLILDRSELDAFVSETEANLYINMTCHTDNEGAQKAYLDFVEQVEPHLKKVGFELDRKIAESPHAAALDQDRYGVLLRGLRNEVDLFRQDNVPLQTEITKLDQQYSQINGAMLVTFRGEEKTLPQMSRFLEETDRSVREDAWKAIADRRLQERDRIDDIFDQMIRLRHQIAVNAGFDNFRDYQHRKMHRFDYAPADCETFHRGAEEVVVPLLRKLNTDRAKALKVDQLRPWDLAVDVRGRSPLRPFSNADDLVSRSSDIFHRMDRDLGNMFDELRGGGCLDLESRKGKAPGGYQYQRQYSRKPFIFMNAAGLHRDLITMVHEAGHAFHSTLCKTDPLVNYRHAPMEFSEVASMSMEMLTYPYLESFYSAEDAARAKRKHLEELASTLAWIATIDAFQHWIYTHPTHSRTERTAKWLELNDRFGPAVSYKGLESALEASWQRQLHLFGVPFYYIEYGIAQLGSLQLWLQSKRNASAAIKNYKSALTLGGSRPLPQLFEAAGLKFDFSPPMMRSLMKEVEGELSALPL